VREVVGGVFLFFETKFRVSIRGGKSDEKSGANGPFLTARINPELFELSWAVIKTVQVNYLQSGRGHWPRFLS
jgi:hypothetical protein